MSVANPRFYKFTPSEDMDLGNNPVRGDFTVDDRIMQQNSDGIFKQWICKNDLSGWGRTVLKKVNGRTKQVWEDGVQLTAGYVAYYQYCGDGVAVLNFPVETPVEEV